MQDNESFHPSLDAGQPLVSELREYQRQIEAVNREARELVAGLDDAQFNWHPSAGQWSIAECLDHLVVTGRVTAVNIRRTAGEARAKGLLGDGPFRYGRLGNWLVQTIEPPPRFRTRAPKAYAPGPQRPVAEVTRDFFALQDELLDLAPEVNGLDLARVKIASPVTRFLKLSLGQWFALLAAHERRHLWQARQITAQPGFARAGEQAG
ncbi:MAG TPA: DinB family protein [Pyrinomonadaceae bacterium]|jgi:hypothetical protein